MSRNPPKPCPTSIFCVTIFIIPMSFVTKETSGAFPRRPFLMLFQPRRRRKALTACIAFSLLLLSLPAWAADKTRLHVDDYQISVELTPHAHKISAHAVVKFTALEDLNIATFNLHNDLRITKVTDATGKLLTAE